jgi:hypothetical protein
VLRKSAHSLKEREREKGERKCFTVTDLNSHGCKSIKDVFAFYSSPPPPPLSPFSPPLPLPLSLCVMFCGVFYIFANMKNGTIVKERRENAFCWRIASVIDSIFYIKICRF